MIVVCKFIHKKCHPESYNSDIKCHLTLHIRFSVAVGSLHSLCGPFIVTLLIGPQRLRGINIRGLVVNHEQQKIRVTMRLDFVLKIH